MKLQYDHIHLIHSDHDAAVRFYKDILGAAEIGRIERGGAPQTKMEVGGTILLVRGIRDGEKPMEAGTLPRMGADHFGFWVGGGEMEEAKGRLGKTGVRILQEGEVPELRFIYFEGPDGVVIEFMERK